MRFFNYCVYYFDDRVYNIDKLWYKKYIFVISIQKLCKLVEYIRLN